MTAERRRLLLVLGAAYGAGLCAALLAAVPLARHHPIMVAAGCDLFATVAVFGFSVRFDNSSVYDPYWSVAPVPIVAYWLAVAAPGAAPLRQALVAGLVALWAVRLTANCLVRWRSLADEDFRYADLRRRSGRAYWLVSLLGLHLMPTAWVFLGLLPLWPALARPGRPVGWLDAVAAALTAGAITLEALADLQLRRFLSARRDPAALLDHGLWGLVRHPNYLGEVLFWWGLWLFGLAADPAWWWTVAGPLAITALFVFVSVPLMERRLAARHPGRTAGQRAG
jgi:steroid 5-alpha reductase family enzyme